MNQGFRFVLSILLALLLVSPHRAAARRNVAGDTTIRVPVGGNTWLSGGPVQAATLSNEGIENWTGERAVFTTYLRVNKPGKISLSVTARAAGKSKLEVSINREAKTVVVRDTAFRRYAVGEWRVQDTGYLKITLRGLSRTAPMFADVTAYEVNGTAINAQTAYVKNNEGNFFYWGRRGPSVHLNYPFADSIKATTFYNEVTVPEGEDVVGSYFMAAGFGEGYFGIQVNSPTERRVLFSVWSPFTTDDPKSIPPDQRITLRRKGEGVHAGEFGNEGSGGQSYLRYNWQAGRTYRFLLKGEPDGNNNTVYTAYFFAPEKGDWMMIASFIRPQTNTYLKRFHSFLENFIPAQGDKERHVLFGNQWIADSAGQWTELTKAVFTYDNTAAKGYRKDYAGGQTDGAFYLKNGGFFSDYTPYRSVFTRPAGHQPPQINWAALPQ